MSDSETPAVAPPAPERPPLRARLAALVCYAGAAPLFRRHASAEPPDFLGVHCRQALALWFLLAAIAAAFILGVAALSGVMVHDRAIYDRFHPEPHLLSVFRKLLLCWMVFWVYGAGLALWGATEYLPLLGRLARRRTIRTLGMAVIGVVVSVVAVLVPLTFYADTFVRDDAKPGKAYFLYEDIGKFPHWLFVLGFHPLARASRDCWGDGNALLLHLTRENIARALAEGTFVFIGSHGGKTGLLLREGYIPPEEIAALPKNPGLKFIYLTSCDSGSKREEWERALAPAKVITYDRLTAVAEHIWWLWVTGPEIVRGME